MDDVNALLYILTFHLFARELVVLLQINKTKQQKTD